MKRILDSKAKMMKAVSQLYLDYKARFDVVPAFAATMTTFDSTLDAINDLIPKSDEKTDPMTKQRLALKLAASKAASLVSKALVSYANSIGDLVLAGDMNWTVAKLKRLSYEKLAPTCTAIYDKGDELKTQALPFGLTQALLDDLTAANNEWTKKETATRNRQVEISENKRRLAKRVNQNMQLLREQLDGMAYTLSETDAELYGLWVQTTDVELPATTQTQVKVTVVNKLTQEPAYDVDLSLQNGILLSTKTNVAGEGEFPKQLKPGLYLFEAAKPGYKPFQIIEYRVLKGKINRVEVALEPEG